MHITSIMIGFAVGAFASAVIVFALVQHRKKEDAAHCKNVPDQPLMKTAAADTDSPPMSFTIDEVGKIIFGEDEEGETSESGEAGYDDLLSSAPIRK